MRRVECRSVGLGATYGGLFAVPRHWPSSLPRWEATERALGVPSAPQIGPFERSTSVHIYVCAYVCECLCESLHVYVCLCACTHMCMHLSVCIYLQVCVCICVFALQKPVFAPTILCPAKSPKHSGVGVCVLLRASPGKARVGVGPSSARQKYG